MRFTITSEYAKVRLDKFLAEHFPEFSRAHLQKLIKDGQVTVNGKPTTPHHFLRIGDAVEAIIEPVAELRVVANPKIVFRNPSQPPLNLRGGDRLEHPLKSDASVGLRPCGASEVRGGRGSYDNVVEVLHEDPDFLVINKPAGLVVHQGAGHKAPDTLANGLLAWYPEIARVGDELIRPGIVHRLDGDVSGVMVIARTQDMFDTLKRQFKLHEIEKEYIAIVDGKVSPSSGTIEFAVARKGAKMVARPKGSEGRRAVTEYEAIPLPRHSEERSDEESPTNVGSRIRAGSFAPLRMTLLRIRTRTGRTHQIRVHLKAKGWPIVGDRLYSPSEVRLGGRSRGPLRQAQGLPSRLMLHARRIAFKDLKGEKREFIVETPQDFNTNP